MQNAIKFDDESYNLWRSILLICALAFVGEITKSMRGITLNFDGKVIGITVFFEREPSDLEIDIVQRVEAEIISHHSYQSDLVIKVSPVNESLIGKRRNWGWVYLRRED